MNARYLEICKLFKELRDMPMSDKPAVKFKEPKPLHDDFDSFDREPEYIDAYQEKMRDLGLKESDFG
jgi:hypothetical protein